MIDSEGLSPVILAFVLLAFSSSCTVMDVDPPSDESEVFTKPEPEYPKSELERRREGWVLVAYSVSRGGIIEDLYVRDSSGNSNLDQAALEGVRKWRYAPGEQRELSALISYVSGQEGTRLSPKFYYQNKQAHELIDEGELEHASEVLAIARDDKDLHPSELAYSFLTEGRIASERGNTAEQLHYYRKAMLDDGRWLAREDYLDVLYVAIVFALDQGDFASAVRDYELLTESRSGRKLGKDLEDLVRTARVRIEADPSVMQPYAVADSSMTVKGNLPPRQYHTFDQQRQPGSGRHGMYNPKKSPSGGAWKD